MAGAADSRDPLARSGIRCAGHHPGRRGLPALNDRALPGLAFTDWDTWAKTINGGPPLTAGKNAVVHRISDDVRVDILFTAWADARSNPGGAFSY